MGKRGRPPQADLSLTAHENGSITQYRLSMLAAAIDHQGTSARAYTRTQGGSPPEHCEAQGYDESES